MEFSFRSQPTAAAADDEENGRLRRFPDPPPPQPHGHCDANTSGVDSALLTRRQELLSELHKGFMHQDMVVRELMETERAMGLTTGGYNYNPVSALPRSQDYSRCWTPSVPSREAPFRQPCPCGCGSSKAVMAPPVYPHVERSLQAPEQTRPGNDAEQHQEGRPSGARIHPFNSYFELCHSPSKQTQVAGKGGINQMRPLSGHQQADAEQHQEGRPSGARIHPFNSYFELCHSPSKQTPVAGRGGINQMRPLPGHQQAVVWEKIGVVDVHNKQPLHEIKNHSSEGWKAIDSAIEDSKETHATASSVQINGSGVCGKQ